MATTAKVLRTLDALNDGYAVFEADQVLTHGQLNGVRDWLDEQGRLTRVDLLGVGIVGGLRVRRGSDGITVTRGVGVTTDGDLLRLPADTLYDQFKPYDASAPEYAPFRPDGQTMFAMAELLPKGESDVQAQPLSQFQPGLDGQAVVMLMESVENDPDLCSGSDCDNLGRDALHRVRLLLMRREDAQTLLPQPPRLSTAGDVARVLPVVVATRPLFDSQVSSTAQYAQRLRASADETLAALDAALAALAGSALAPLLAAEFGSDPVEAWRGRLKEQAGRAAAPQLRSGFVEDLADAWNALRDALLDDDTLLLPPADAFPKHLLLGAVADPQALRTGLHRSPLLGPRGAPAFAARRFDALLGAYEPPADTALRVTPSRRAGAPIGDRAIPWHYRSRSEPPLHTVWNERLSGRGDAARVAGYRAADWAADNAARNPLAGSIAAVDFFRVEGHLGQPVAEVHRALQQTVAAQNLPFAVRAVLLHTERRRIVVKPGIRYGSLHAMQYLLRQDVAAQAEDSRSYTDVVGERARATATGEDFSLGEGASVEQAIASTRQALAAEVPRVAEPLRQPTYSAYRAAADWRPGLTNTLAATGGLKATLGGVLRTDFGSPFDTLIGSRVPDWVGWLDQLIDARDDRADQRLLFGRFVKDHPGLASLGGVERGGTFVLLYDDAGRVVGDVALPYHAPGEDEEEPEEPPLTKPPIRPPLVVDQAWKFVRPVDRIVTSKLDKFQTQAATQLKTEFQADYLKFFSESLKSFGTITGPKTGRLPTDIATGNAVLDLFAADVAAKQDVVDRTRDLLGTALTEPERKVAEERFAKAQTDLADAIAATSRHVVDNKLDVGSGAAAPVGTLLADSIGRVSDAQATTKLAKELKRLGDRAEGPSVQLIGNLQRFGRFGR